MTFRALVQSALRNAAHSFLQSISVRISTCAEAHRFQSSGTVSADHSAVTSSFPGSPLRAASASTFLAVRLKSPTA